MYTKLRNINKSSFNKQLALPLTFKSIKNRDNFIVSKMVDNVLDILSFSFKTGIIISRSYNITI